MPGYAYEDPRFQPSMRLISAITNAENASITTTFDHDYEDGIIVRFYIPIYYGMRQLDNKTGTITVTGNTTFTVDIDTRTFDTFIVPVHKWWHSKAAMVVPIGEINSKISAAVRNVT